MFRRLVLSALAFAAVASLTPRLAHAEGEFVMKLATVAPEGTP